MQRRGRGYINNSLDFERIKTNSIFRNNKTEDSSGFDTKDTLVRIQSNVIVSAMKKYLLKMIEIVMALTWMSRKIIQIRLNDVFNVMESIGHRSLKSSPSILKAKRDIFICKIPPQTDKGGLILMSWCNVYLVITKKTIHKWKYLSPSIFIDDLVYKMSGIIILWTGMIKVTVINTNSNGALFLSQQYDIGHPIYQRDRINKSSFKKFFNFPFNGGRFSRVHWTKSLTNGLRVCLLTRILHPRGLVLQSLSIP